MIVETSPIVSALVFLINAILGIYIFFLILRFLIQWLGVGFREPMSRFVLDITNPPLVYFNRFVPRWRNIDLGAFVLALLLEILKLGLTLTLYGQKLSLIVFLLACIFGIVAWVLYIFIGAITVQAILSWIIPPDAYSPLGSFLYRFNEPILRPVRRRIPSYSGIDFSPLIVVLILLTILKLISY